MIRERQCLVDRIDPRCCRVCMVGKLDLLTIEIKVAIS